GWVQYELLKDDDGNIIGSRWIVSDDPGEPMTEDQFAEDEASEIDDTDDEGAAARVATKTAAPESQAPDAASQADRASASATGPPRNGCVAHPTQNSTPESRRNTLDEDRDSKNTMADDHESAADGLPPPPFGAMLCVWPRDNINSAF